MSREGKEMNRTSWKKSPAELVERFAIALPEHPAVVRKPMFGYPAAFANGNMVCGLFQDSVVVRLGKEGAASAVADGRAQQFTPMPGRTMSGYVLVPTVEANDTRALAAWLQQALDFTLTLPKKAAKVPAKKASKAKPRKAQ
jgi:TfoX/Sxy family transcriptional regulator of competence genes